MIKPVEARKKYSEVDQVFDRYFRIVFAMVTFSCWFYVLFVYFIMQLPTPALGGAVLSLANSSAFWVKRRFGNWYAVQFLGFTAVAWELLFMAYTGGVFSPGLPWLATVPYLAGLFLGRRGVITWTVFNCLAMSALWVFADYLPANTLSPERFHWYFLTTFAGLSTLLLVTLQFGELFSKAKFQKQEDFILETAGIGLWKMSVADWRFVWDKSMYSVLGLNSTGSREASDIWNAIVHPEDQNIFTHELKKGVEEHCLIEVNVRVVTRTGKMKYIRMKGEPILNEDGKFAEVVGASWDITQQTELQQNFDRERALALHSTKLAFLGEMAGGVAHEINNPLAIIQASADQIKELNRDSHIDRSLVEKKLNVISVTVNRIAKIVQGLRSFSKNSKNDCSQLVNVTEVVEQTLSLCQEKLKGKGIEVIKEFGKSDLAVLALPSQVSQILLNLISNSEDALAEKNIQSKLIRIQVTSDDKNIYIKIFDSGAEIPQEVREKIFQPFFTTKEIGKGTGLGLSASLGIMRSFDGNLTFDPRFGSTCFVMSFPKPTENRIPLTA